MTAIFSPCRTWRYTLERSPLRPGAYLEGQKNVGGDWMPLSTVAFIGLNPSTADETVNDPTVRRCINYAGAWGFDRMLMLNAFAYRSTDPKVLKGLSREDAIGPENDRYLCEKMRVADLVVCAWGVHGTLWRRGESLREFLPRQHLHVLGLTKDGHPKHPLYLRGDLKPVPWI